MTKKEILNNLIGTKTQEELYGKKFDFVVTNIVEEEVSNTEYLDSEYTREELIDLADNLSDSYTQYEVYGKLKNKKDIKKVNELQELSNIRFLSSLGGSASGCPPIKWDYSNEVLLKIFKDGDSPYN